MQPKFNKKGNELVEQPRMEKPTIDMADMLDHSCKKEIGEMWNKYFAHIKSLRRIPILPGSKWPKTEGLEEVTDFKIEVYCDGRLFNNKLTRTGQGVRCDNCKEYAFPIDPVKEETQRMFTLEEMKEAIRFGADRANTFCGYPSELEKYLQEEEKDYFKTQYNIDL